jgi:hypothetical protein
LKRKLLLLNAALVLLLASAGWRFRQDWLAARAREAAERSVKLKPAPPPPFTPLPTPTPVTPAGYADIAQQLLFDRSRNPTVVIEAPKTEPPKPKPMPPLPVYHGQMNLGDGPVVIFSQTASSANEAVHPGESIGQFKLVGVNKDEVTFEWDGNTIRKTVDELTHREVVQESAAAAPAPARTEAPAAVSAPAASVTAAPGADYGGSSRPCVAGDNSPAGTVADGFRKVLSPTPFGSICRWDPIGR